MERERCIVEGIDLAGVFGCHDVSSRLCRYAIEALGIVEKRCDTEGVVLLEFEEPRWRG